MYVLYVQASFLRLSVHAKLEKYLEKYSIQT